MPRSAGGHSADPSAAPAAHAAGSVAARPLARRRAIVTGGGSGIGRAIALALGQAGAEVAVAGRRVEPLQRTVEELRASGAQAHWAEVDVRDRESVQGAIARLVAALGGRLDVLVNNAGVGGPNAGAVPGPERWDDVVRTNLDGTFFCARVAAPSIRDGGRVVNVSSVLGKFGVPGYTAYCAAKHGVIGLTKALALELAPRGVTVNAICPGWTETEMAREGMQLIAEQRGVGYEQARREALAMVPLGRMVQPAEVGDLVVFLCSAAAANMTGQAISLCGGSTMG